MNDKYDFSKIFDKVLNRPIHKRLTDDIIKNTTDEDLTQLVIDNIQVNNKKKTDGEIYSKLTRGQRIVYSTYILETQVLNEGFGGFYLNTNCELNQFVGDDLISLDAESFADVVNRANEQGKLIESGKADSTILYPLDKEFHKLIEMDSLDVRRVKYIRGNPTQFISE